MCTYCNNFVAALTSLYGAGHFQVVIPVKAIYQPLVCMFKAVLAGKVNSFSNPWSEYLIFLVNIYYLPIGFYDSTIKNVLLMWVGFVQYLYTSISIPIISQ